MNAIEPIAAASPSARSLRPTLVARAAVLALAFAAEKSALNLLVDFRLADAARGPATVLRLAQHFGLRLAVALAIALAVLAWVGGDPTLRAINEQGREARLRPAWLAAHGALLALLAATAYNLYGNHGIELPIALAGGVLVLLAAAAALPLLCALAPWRLWRRAAGALGMRWLYAGLAAILGTGAIVWSQALWAPTAQLTFELVRDLLAPLIPSLQAVPASRLLRTAHFAVRVSDICSGLEGVGLMLAFTAAWLLYFRAEYRFPRALILVPAGLLAVFALNVLRIAVLVLIGNAGHPAVAIYGFHSQAGWIAFNCAACGIALVSRRSRWLNRAAQPPAARASAGPDGTAAYLAPLLTILAAGMLTRAISSGFETWYALRLAAAGATLVLCAPRLRGLDWRFGWRGLAAGAVAGGLWLVAARLLPASHGVPAHLVAMSASPRMLWLAGRAATSIVAMPVAEELAYRGYLMRRLVAPEFETVRFGAIGALPWLVSAAASGLLYGTLWLPGVAAALIYGLVLIRTGRMGEAVAAHVTGNLLAAVWVLAAGQWQLW